MEYNKVETCSSINYFYEIKDISPIVSFFIKKEYKKEASFIENTVMLKKNNSIVLIDNKSTTLEQVNIKDIKEFEKYLLSLK